MPITGMSGTGANPSRPTATSIPRFMSEFGFQALPPLATIRTYAEEADWNMTSYIMERHQKNDSGNQLMVAQMLDTFRLPKDFESLVYLSLVLQAEGIRYGVEHWRRYPQPRFWHHSTGSSTIAGRWLPGRAWITLAAGKPCIMPPAASTRR